MQDDCSHCGQRYALDSGNTRLFEYTHPSHRMFSYLMSECPACTGNSRIYLVPEGILEAKTNGICVVLEATAPSVVQAGYWRAMGIKQLSKHQELEVKFFAYLLEHELA